MLDGNMLDGSWAIQFIENLTLCGEYSNLPFTLRPWQKEVVRNLFARKNEKENKYKRSLCFWPRGQAKTQLAAGVILTRLIGDPRNGQNIFSCAKNQKQASLVFDRCAQMVRQDPYLESLCDVSDFYKRITIKSKFSSYQALAADTSGGSIHGLDPSFIVFDELHAQGRRRDYFSAIETSLGKRLDQQLLIISTAGEVGGICEEEFDYAKKIADDPSIDPEYYASLYYLGEDDPCLCGKHDTGWRCPEQWAKVNPALGDFKQLQAMEQMARQAEDNPAKQVEFKKFHLNMFQSDTEAFLNMDRWKEGGRMEVLSDDFVNTPVWAGLDLGAVSDFTALVLIAKLNKGGVKALPYYWIPKDRIPELQHRTKAPIQSWVDLGYIKATQGNVTDFDVVREDINALAKQFNIEKVGLDPHNATQTAVQLDGDGIPLEWFRQGFVSMNSPCKELQRLVASGQLHHGANPVLSWMANNALAVYDSNSNVKIDRRDRNRKVDGVVSLAMAIGVAGLCEPQKSVYQSRGALVI